MFTSPIPQQTQVHALSSLTSSTITTGFAMAQIRPHSTKRQHQTEHEPVRITSRTPVPLDSGRPSLAQLPNDVVLLVLTFVEDSDLLKIASLSSTLYEQARHVQNHTVHINLDQRNQAWSRLDVLRSNLLLPSVRVLEVSGSSNTDQGRREEDKILSCLANMLPSMTGLRDLHWHIAMPIRSDRLWRMPAPIPRATLNHMPTQTRLHTSVAAMDEPHERVHAFLAQLVDNHNLFSLSVHIAFFDEHACRTAMRTLKQVLLSCPRLVRIPMLYVGPPDYRVHGVVDGPAPGAPYCGLGLSGGERPPALEELGLACYPWGREPTAALLAISSIYCTGYPEKGNEVQYWAQTFDWSRLRRLNNIPSNLALEIAPKLTALKEITLDLCWDKTKLTPFLEQIPTALELLSIPNWSYIGDKHGAITQHGAGLRKLAIHCLEPRKADSLMTDTDLVTLCNGLPHLEELTLDIARDKARNAWPYSTLDIIASFQCLRSIQLWFELGTGRPELPIPHLTVSAAHQLFAYIRERNKNIRHLELCSGTPRKWVLHGDPSWASQNSIRLLCEVSLRDGDTADRIVRVTCPDFSTKMNAELGRLSKETREDRRGVAEDSKRLLLEVDLDGPLTFDEWSARIQLTWERWEAREKARQPEQPQLQQKSVFKRLVSSVLKCI
jgi:hypothetical protein